MSTTTQAHAASPRAFTAWPCRSSCRASQPALVGLNRGITCPSESPTRMTSQIPIRPGAAGMRVDTRSAARSARRSCGRRDNPVRSAPDWSDWDGPFSSPPKNGNTDHDGIELKRQAPDRRRSPPSTARSRSVGWGPADRGFGGRAGGQCGPCFSEKIPFSNTASIPRNEPNSDNGPPESRVGEQMRGRPQFTGPDSKGML